MSGTEPPADNDLGQNARPLTHLSLDNFGPRGTDKPPDLYKVCAVCGFIYKRRDMVKFRQKWYCKAQSCNEDIVGIRLKENPEANIKNQGLSDRFNTLGE